MTRFNFGPTSLVRLETVHPDLRRLIVLVMNKQIMDFTILQGHRGEVEQNAAFERGASKKRWPGSKHNATPSLAIDIAPYPIRWGNVGEPDRHKAIGAFYKLAGVVLTTANDFGIAVRWGGDWDMDGDIFDQTFDDLPHYELLNP